MKREKALDVGRAEVIIKSALIGIFSTVLVMLMFAAVMLGLGTDRAYAVPFATVSLAVGSALSAFYAAHKIGNKGYLVGLAVGLAVFVLITAVSLAVCKDSVTLNTLFHFIIVMLASLAGGIAGVNRKGSKKYI